METTTQPPPAATPANGLPAETASEIRRVFELQKGSLQRLRNTGAEERIAKLKRFRKTILAHRQDIRDALFADFRKAPEEVDLTEIGTVLVEIKHTVEHLKKWMRPKKVRTPLTLLGTSSEIRYEPKGRGLIISPWNYPVNLTFGPLVGAVAAGCTAVIKPSEYCPETTRLMKAILAEVFPEDEVALFEGDYRVSQALLELPFDHIYFTGSTEVGKIVMRAAAEHLASVTLELGGKSPTILDETADVREAAAKIAYGKFTNKGQTCIAPDYVYVHESIHDAFVEALREKIHAFYGESAEARASSADYARIISDRHHARLTEMYEEAIEKGATAVTGGTSRPEERFIDPTVLTGVPPEAQVMREEIFGPVLPVLKFRTLDEVVAALNDHQRPLALYIFSHNDRNVEYLLSHTTAGGTCVNDTLLHFLHPELPFGGVGTSGMGQAHGYHNFLAFTNERPVLRQKLKNGPFKHFYPPYTKTTRKLINAMFKLLGA
ncbi:aldehyde dehydrogenase family protein [Rhodocaloribacter sp.]